MNKLGVSLPWDYLSDTIITKEAEVITKNFGKSTTYTHIHDLGPTGRTH